MNTGKYLREKTKPLFDLIGKLFAKTGINPTLFSALAIPISGIGAFAFYEGEKEIALGIFIFAALWDLFDGPVARYQNKTSEFGYYIEGIIDKWVEIVMFLGFAVSGYALEAFIMTSGILMLSFVKPRAAMVTQIGEFDWPSLGSRHERLFVILFALLINLFQQTIEIGNETFDSLSIGLYIVFLMTLIGELQRILLAKRIIEAGGIDNMTEITDRER